ncbi:hypothetical protein ONZ45_g4812 [Pleurotus djamor]|nr:hypothetical protein ONZ45_g4812 [Pleurotus djamor]
MDNYQMTSTEGHYNSQGQRTQQANWQPTHMMPPHAHPGQSSFAAPVTPSAVQEHGQHYPFYPSQQQVQGTSQPQNSTQPAGDQSQAHGMSRTTSALSLNLSSLSVASPTNLSPINPPQSSHGHPSNALSPVAPLSPANNHPYHHHNIASQFQFNPPDLPSVPQQQGGPGQVPGSSHGPGSGASTPYDESTPQQQPYDRRMAATPTTASRSSSASTSHSTSTSLSSIGSSAQVGLPRKRSFSSNAASTDTLVEVDEAYDESMDTTTPGSYDDMDMRYTPGPGTGTGNVSPVDGSGSGGEDGLVNGGAVSSNGIGMGGIGGGGGGGLNMGLGSVGNMNVLGKPMATNNFVTKLYQ